MSSTKTIKNYVYKGLGFPILLEEVTMDKVRGKWLLKIDINKLAKVVFKALPSKPSGLTGAEIRFARTHLGMSKRGFAQHLNVSHTAVNKWEQTLESKAHIDPLVEVALRAFLRLQVEEKNFSVFYKEIMDEAKNFMTIGEGTPLKIAI